MFSLVTSVQQEDMMDTIATTTSTFGLNQFTKQEILTAQDECKHTSEIKALLTGEYSTYSYFIKVI